MEASLASILWVSRWPPLHHVQVLVSKCLARRMCKACGKNFNLADIDLPASLAEPAVKMPPLLPPAGCASRLEARSDDNLETVQRRLQARQALPFLACPYHCAHVRVFGGGLLGQCGLVLLRKSVLTNPRTCFRAFGIWYCTVCDCCCIAKGFRQQAVVC